MKRRNLIVFLLMSFLLISVTAQAQDWYVKAGAKKGKGTQELPYKGVYKALNKALKGDVIGDVRAERSQV